MALVLCAACAICVLWPPRVLATVVVDLEVHADTVASATGNSQTLSDRTVPPLMVNDGDPILLHDISVNTTIEAPIARAKAFGTAFQRGTDVADRLLLLVGSRLDVQTFFFDVDGSAEPRATSNQNATFDLTDPYRYAFAWYREQIGSGIATASTPAPGNFVDFQSINRSVIYLVTPSGQPITTTEAGVSPAAGALPLE